MIHAPTSLLLIPTGFFRRLGEVADRLFPDLFEFVLRHLGFLWDVLGVFLPIFALFGLAATAIAGLHCQDWLTVRRLPRMRELAAADERDTPTLRVVSEPTVRGLIFKRDVPSTSVQIDDHGLTLKRPAGTQTVAWNEVAMWRRHGLADWSLWLNDGYCSVQFLKNDRIADSDLKKIDLRLALYVTQQPQYTLREELELKVTNAREWLRARLSLS